MNKAKRKGQALNLKRYWLIFGVLAIVLAIPFRIVGNWGLTVTLWALISIALGFHFVSFIKRYGWAKKSIVVLLVCCMMIPVFQIFRVEQMNNCSYGYNNHLLSYASCNVGCLGSGGLSDEYIVLKHTSLGIWSSKSGFGLMCLF